MRYRLLGPLQVVHAAPANDTEVLVDVGPRKQRAVLAVLLLARGSVVSVDRLIDAVWGDDVPASATASLQAYVSNLRRALRGGGTGSQVATPIVRQSPGYYLAVGPDDVDLTVFGAFLGRAAAAIEASRWEGALAETDTALALWRGPFLEDLGDEPWVAPEAALAEQLRRDCLDYRISALLALGRIPAALSAATQLSAADPLSDRGCWLHVLSLYRAGRTSDALAAFTRHARMLDDEMGLQPGAELRDLQTAILRQAPELAAWPRQPEWTGAAQVATPTGHVAPVTSQETPPRASLVGRDRELSTVASLLDDVAAGATRWLVLSGPPGIGKTRLAEEVAARVVDGGGRVVWVGCPDESGTPPWWPMRQLVRALGGDADELLRVPANADPDIARFQVYERIQSLLESVGDVRAVVVDDVQWADSASTGCLAYIAGALREHPVALVVTVRDGEPSPELRRLLGTVARGPHNRHLEVPALSSRDVAALATQVADEVVTDAEAATLAVRTGGNPFFVCEYARLPRDERQGNEIPVAVKAVLDRRFAGLDPAVLQMLRTAAVVGDEVDVPVLAKATGLDIDTLADYLDEAADERIVVPSHAGDGYAFAHGLLREQLMASLPALRRQRLHAKIAEVLQDGVGADALTRRAQHLVAAQPLVEPDVVVRACRRAAEDAAQRWSSDIAATWWQAALDAYDRLPVAARDDEERDALTVAMLDAHSRAGRGRLVLQTVEQQLTEALRAGRTATAGRVASALLRASGGWPWLAPGEDPGELLVLLERSAEVADRDAGAGARVLAALAVGHCYDPDPAVPAAHLDHAQRLAETTGDSDVVADVLVGQLITYSGVATHSEQALAWSDRLNVLQHSRSREDRVIANSVCTMAAMNLGDVDETIRRLAAGIEGSEEMQLPVLRAQLRWMEAVLAVWRGDFAEAKRHHGIAAYVHEQTELYGAGSGLMAEVSLLRETGGPIDPQWQAMAATPETGGQDMLNLVRAALLTVADGPEVATAGETILAEWLATRERPHVWTTLGHLALLAHLAADGGHAHYARPLIEELEPFGDRVAVIGQIGVVGPVALATARLRWLLGDRAHAAGDLESAREMGRRTGAVPTLVRCDLLAAELAESEAQRRALATDVAARADRLGMNTLRAAALRLC
ncbi:BTAD domain-containing putative transcriptional regulator [Mycolicibacterium sp. 050158]|uniref:BTAD domain-containing putative transcriptional regulator n=1 Tax=Mycolicibacterium sp. 050158 TaxID=3090602 RepID=UPI00299CD94B|nr:BTAD domain-containing putative transcriptional regulator [Mycolicibacterium sp. 050158]MDX1888659.1 BTAD domain-containing putative transcriptional regulator [Mycolicibacterium sp. 050158]